MKKEHILVIRFSALGDVAMAVPVVYSLAKQHPDIRITVLSRNMARPLFENLAPNVGFMGADLKGEYRGIRGLNALYRRLTAKQFTAIADLHSVLRSEFLRMRFNMSNCKVAHINKHRKGRRKLTSIDNRQLSQQPTTFQNYVEVFEQLGYSINIQFTSIFPSEGGDLSMLPATMNTKNAGEQWIGIAPFAAHEGKIYPTHLMHQVIAQLTQQHPQARIFLFGRGEKEDKYFTEWCQEFPTCTYVSQHIDSMYEELIVVSVWGATHPLAGFMGWNQSKDNAIQADLDCRPCSIFGQKPCKRGDYACLNLIKPETIVEKINTLLQTKQND